MESLNCPHCHSENLKNLEDIQILDIAKQYKKLLKTDISKEYKNRESISLFLCNKCSLEFYYPMILGSNEFYSIIQKRFNEYYPQEKFDFNFAIQHIVPGDKILEIGCGDGNFAKKNLIENYVGLELSPAAAINARKNGYKIFEETLEDFEKKSTEKFDIVCCFQILEHVFNIKEFLISAANLLKKDGLLILTVPSRDSFLSHVVNNVMNMPPHHQSFWSNAALKNIEQTAPFKMTFLEHELAQGEQAKWYLATIFHEKFRKIFHLPFKKVDNSIFNTILRKLAGLVARFFESSLKEACLCPRGHTVGAIFKKLS